MVKIFKETCLQLNAKSSPECLPFTNKDILIEWQEASRFYSLRQVMQHLVALAMEMRLPLRHYVNGNETYTFGSSSNLSLLLWNSQSNAVMRRAQPGFASSFRWVVHRKIELLTVIHGPKSFMLRTTASLQELMNSLVM